jgi:predicted ribosome quality control (RQC) complex YloA/Tae2 family protein
LIIDGLFIHHLVKELNQEIANSRLEKIYQNDDSSFIFVFYSRGIRKYLSLRISSSQFGINLTSNKITNDHHSQFLASLKKHLENAILDNISQYKSDRVIIFEFLTFDIFDGKKVKKIIFEVMGRHSNVMIISDDIIIDTYKKMFFDEGRQLLPQAKFEFFPSDKLSFDSIDYTQIFSPKDLVNKYLGISPSLADYLFNHQIQIHEIKLLPTKDLIKNQSYVFDIFDKQNDKKYYKSISEMFDDKIEVKKNHYLSHEQFILKQLAKYQKKHENLEKMLDDAIDNLKTIDIGHLIYQSGLDLNQKMSSIDINNVHIVLDPTLSLNQNAQNYFKKYQKAKRSIDHIKEQINQNSMLTDLFLEYKTYLSFQNQDSITELENELEVYGFKKAKKIAKPKKKIKKPNILKINDGDSVIYIGKNNIQNEYLTHELAKKEDYFFHVKDAPGAHVILDTKKLDEHILRLTAMLAAYFSSQKQSSSIPVDYIKVKHLKKIKGLPGYKVSYSNHQTIYIDIDQDKIESLLNKV